MSSSLSSRLRHSRRRPVAASIGALFALSTVTAWAVPPAVTNCNDGSPPPIGPPPIAQPPVVYPRVSGASADIGAHEGQKPDIVFYTEFENGCL